MLKGKNLQVNFNQVINKDEVQKQKKIPEIAVVTKIPNIPDNNIINQNNDIYNQFLCHHLFSFQLIITVNSQKLLRTFQVFRSIYTNGFL